GRVGGERAGRAVLEALVHREDDHLPGAAEAAVVQEPGDVGEGAGAVAPVPGQDFLHAIVHGCLPHSDRPSQSGFPVRMKVSYRSTSAALPTTNGERACADAASTSSSRFVPSLARPPACSVRYASGRHSYIRRSFPCVFFGSAG